MGPLYLYYDAFDASQRIDYKPGQGTSLCGLARIARKGHDFEQAQDFCEEGLKILGCGNYNPTEGTLHQELGEIFRVQRKYAEALVCYQRSLYIALNLCSEIPPKANEKQIFWRYYRMAEAFEGLRQWVDARQQYGNALQSALKTADVLGQMDCHVKLAGVLASEHLANEPRGHHNNPEEFRLYWLPCFEAQIPHWQKLLALAESVNHLERQASAHQRLAVCYEELGREDEANKSIITSIEIFTLLGDKRAAVSQRYLKGFSKRS